MRTARDPDSCRSEDLSRGEFAPDREGGGFGESFSDATFGWPLVGRAAIERLEEEPA